jgi:hypothetical protein
MKPENSNPGDDQLSALLRTGRVAPSLPPRFQENVWRRIEDAEAPVNAGSWLDALASLILRPRFALAAVTILVCAGALFGVHSGARSARQEAQVRYLEAVAPITLH